MGQRYDQLSLEDRCTVAPGSASTEKTGSGHPGGDPAGIGADPGIARRAGRKPVAFLVFHVKHSIFSSSV